MKIKMPDGSIEEFSDDTPKEFIKEKALKMASMLEGSLKVKMPDGTVLNFTDSPEGRAQAKSIAQKMIQSVEDVEEQEIEEQRAPLNQEKTGAMRAFEQGITLGLADEIAGAAGATRGALKKGVNIAAEALGKEGDLLPLTEQDTYVGARDTARAKDLQAAEEGGKLYKGIEIVGSIGSGAGVVKGAQSLKGAITAGATAGGLAGAGYSTEDEVKGVVLDAAKGAVLGAAVPAMSGGVGKVVKGAAQGTVNKAKLSGQIREAEPFLSNLQSRVQKSNKKLTNAGNSLKDKQAYIKTLEEGTPEFNKASNQIKNLTNKVKEEKFSNSKLAEELNIAQKYMDKLEGQRGLLGKFMSKAGMDSKMLSSMAAASIIMDSAVSGGLAGGLVYKVVKGNKSLAKPLDKAITSAGRLRDKQVGKINRGLIKALDKQLKNSDWGIVLRDARALSPATMAAAHYQLLTIDPEYRKKLKEITEEDNQTLMFNNKSRSNAKD